MAFPYGLDALTGTGATIAAVLILGIIGNAIAKFGIFAALGVAGAYYVYDNTANILYSGATVLVVLLGGLLKK